MSSIARLGSANTYDNALSNLSERQKALSDVQEKLTAGKRVLRPSDDPTAAAQAERAITKGLRIQTDQRALAAQRNSVAMAETTLGDVADALASFRELAVSAGNAGYATAERQSIASQLQGLRDQILSYANRTDTNGLPLFGSLGSALTPFSNTATGVVFAGLGGQGTTSEVNVPNMVDGRAAFMSAATGNGVFQANLGATNVGTLFTDQGRVTNPGALTGDTYAITFAGTPTAMTYTVTNTTTAAVVLTAQPYTSGQDISFDGMTLNLQGAPVAADSVAVTPSTTTGMFDVMDAVISGLKSAGDGSKVNQIVNKGLTELDIAAERASAVRGFTGNLLNRADNINNVQSARSVQLEADRSRAEDMDMIQGVSDMQTKQTGYQAALQSYAQIQKLSLFNFLN